MWMGSGVLGDEERKERSAVCVYILCYIVNIYIYIYIVLYSKYMHIYFTVYICGCVCIHYIYTCIYGLPP